MRLFRVIGLVVFSGFVLGSLAAVGQEAAQDGFAEGIGGTQHFGQLILVKEFSMEKVVVEGPDKKGKKAAKALEKKKKRLTSVLLMRLKNRLARNGYNSGDFKGNEGASGVLVVDGEFVKIYRKKNAMTVRFWVYHSDDPKKRLFQKEVSAVSTAGPVSIGSVAMNNLAHNVIAQLQIALPPIIEHVK